MARSLLHHTKQGVRDLCHAWISEVKRVFSDEGALIFMILVPLFYPLLYSWIYTNEVVREVPVAIVDMSKSQTSKLFIRELDATPDVHVAYHCMNMDEAKRLEARQEVRGIIYLPEDFSVMLNRGQQTHVGLYCDMSLMLTYKALFTSTQAVALNINADIQKSKGGGYTERDDELTVEPISVHEIPIFNTTGGYGNALIPAVLILIMQQTLLLGVGLIAGTEREKRSRKIFSPTSDCHAGVCPVVFGKMLCYLMIYAIMGAYLVLVVPRLFGYTCLLTPTTFLGFLLPYTLACIFFSMTVSYFVRYRENVMLLVVFTSVPFLFLTGVSWPQSNIPSFWEGVSYLLPSTFGIRGFLRLNGMGATLADIQPEYLGLWTQVACYFLLTCLVYYRQRHLGGKNKKPDTDGHEGVELAMDEKM